MTKASQQQTCAVFDLDSESYVNCCLKEQKDQPLADQSQPNKDAPDTKVSPQFSEVLWECALKRHCDSRQNVRNLLDRYIKPHH